MDPLILVYLWVLLISVCLLTIILLLGIIIRWMTKRDENISYEFFKNLIYAIFTGIAVIIILELRGESISNPIFWMIKVPISIGLVTLFSLFGLIYLHLLKIVFRK